MQLSFASVMELTKLTVRDPRMASLLAKAANLPLQASILIIVVTGVIAGFVSGLVNVITPAPPPDPGASPAEVFVFEQMGPMVMAMLSIFGNLTLTGMLFWVGGKFGGRARLEDVAAVSAALQIAMTGILILQMAVRLIAPFFYFAVFLFGAYVFFRGLGHAVNVAHDYDDMATSAAVIVLSLVASVLLASFMVAILGIGPELPVEGTGL